MDQKKAVWIACVSGAAMAGGALARQGLNYTWRALKDDEPPQDAADPDVAWRDAIIWTMATGALVGLARLVARRSAAAGWTRITGELPPFD